MRHFRSGCSGCAGVTSPLGSALVPHMRSAHPGINELTPHDAGCAAAAVPDVLLVVGDGKLVSIELDGRDLVIGRGEDCDVVLKHHALSRRHAIFGPGPPATVQDLGSTNGTRVGGELRHGGEPVVLGAGEGFHVGPFAFIVVRHEASRKTTGSGVDLLRIIDPSAEGVPPLVHDVARSGANILILGETGVGKELLASTVHKLSGRTGALTCINCAALSESLLESELFGHEKGSFTGAASQKAGLIEAADHGTVFLDEIGELSRASQAKLLRVVEHREVLRLGAIRPTALDVRFIAATHRDLLAEVEAGEFRRDLFFRLDGVQLVIPPLRERRARIAPLALRFLDEARARTEKPGLRLDSAAVSALEAHAWPGNVRELKAVIERAALLVKGDEIKVKHLRFARRPATPGAPAPPAAPVVAEPPHAERAPDGLRDEQRVDRDRLLQALEECGGNQSRAAKRLGISRTTMVTKLALYRIRRPRA